MSNNTSVVVDTTGRATYTLGHAKVTMYSKGKTVYDQMNLMMGTLAWSVSDANNFTENTFFVDVLTDELKTIEFYCLEDSTNMGQNVICMKTIVGLGLICKIDSSYPRIISVTSSPITGGTRYTYTIPTIATNTKNIPLYAITYPVNM